MWLWWGCVAGTSANWWSATATPMPAPRSPLINPITAMPARNRRSEAERMVVVRPLSGSDADPERTLRPSGPAPLLEPGDPAADRLPRLGAGDQEAVVDPP